MNDKPKRVYPSGVRVFKPKEGTAKFRIASVVITPSELMDWISKNGEHLSEYNGLKQVKLQITEWDGKYQISVDNYVPKPREEKKEEEFRVPDSGDEQLSF